MSLGSQLFGSKPTVPVLTPIDLGVEQQKAIAANQAALPGAEKLVGQANLFSREQIDQMLASAGIDMAGVGKDIMGNASSLIKGQLPEDVATQRWNKSVGKSFGLGTGGGGTGMGRDLVARDLGLTSLQLMQEGQSLADNWISKAASVYGPSMINVGSMFISPAQQANFDVEERNAQFERQWLANQISAMKAPWAADFEHLVATALSAYSGTPVQENPYDKSPRGSGLGGGGGGYGGGGGMGGGWDTGGGGAYEGGGGDYSMGGGGGFEGM